MMNFINGYGTEQGTQPGPEIYSFHSGGAMHVFADGSVHFVKASTNIRLFVKLLTRSGDDIVTDY